jgi:hypothetical protein
LPEVIVAPTQVLLFSDGENDPSALPDGIPDWGARLAIELQMRGFYGPIHTFALRTPCFQAMQSPSPNVMV